MRYALKARSLGLTVFVASMLFLSPACHRQVAIQNVPPNISQQAVTNWYAAVGLYKTLGSTTEQLTNAVIQLKADFPDQASYDATLQGLGRASQIGIQAGLYLQTVPTTWDGNVSQKVAAYANQIQDQVNFSVNDGIAHVKNPTSQKALLALVATINASIKTAIAWNTPAGGTQ